MIVLAMVVKIVVAHDHVPDEELGVKVIGPLHRDGTLELHCAMTLVRAHDVTAPMCTVQCEREGRGDERRRFTRKRRPCKGQGGGVGRSLAAALSVGGVAL